MGEPHACTDVSNAHGSCTCGQPHACADVIDAHGNPFMMKQTPLLNCSCPAHLIRLARLTGLLLSFPQQLLCVDGGGPGPLGRLRLLALRRPGLRRIQVVPVAVHHDGLQSGQPGCQQMVESIWELREPTPRPGALC